MMETDTLNKEIGILTRREVEARILKPFVEALAERFDKDEVHEVLTEVVKEAARASGAQMTETEGDLSIEHFASHWEPWFRGGALEIEELKRNDEVWNFNVTRCRYAEMYRALGMADLGATLSCNRDAALVEGYQAKGQDEIVLERTQTIMQGASCCDFRYKRKT